MVVDQSPNARLSSLLNSSMAQDALLLCDFAAQRRSPRKHASAQATTTPSPKLDKENAAKVTPKKRNAPVMLMMSTTPTISITVSPSTPTKKGSRGGAYKAVDLETSKSSTVSKPVLSTTKSKQVVVKAKSSNSGQRKRKVKEEVVSDVEDVENVQPKTKRIVVKAGNVYRRSPVVNSDSIGSPRTLPAALHSLVSKRNGSNGCVTSDSSSAESDSDEYKPDVKSANKRQRRTSVVPAESEERRSKSRTPGPGYFERTKILCQQCQCWMVERSNQRTSRVMLLLIHAKAHTRRKQFKCSTCDYESDHQIQRHVRKCRPGKSKAVNQIDPILRKQWLDNAIKCFPERADLFLAWHTKSSTSKVKTE